MTKRLWLLLVAALFVLVACDASTEQAIQDAAETVQEVATENADTVNEVVEQAQEVVEDVVGGDEASEGEMAETDGLPSLGGREVTVAVENAYLPFNYIDLETGEPAGWDYAVIDRLGELLDFTPVYITAPWEGMIQAVADGEFDMAADGITITEDRAQIVDFSMGYINIDQRLLVRKGEDRFDSADSFVADESLMMGTQSGTTNFETASELLPLERIQAFDQFGFAVEALINGDVDAVILDETAGQGYLGVNADSLELVGESLSGDQLGFIYPQGSELVAAIDAGLQEMMSNGELAAINSEYFSDAFTVTYDDIGDPTAAAGGDEMGEMAELMPVSVCEVTDVGGIDDNSFNATAWEGAQTAAEMTGGTAQFLESQQQTDYERNIGAFIDEGCDLIVTVGFLLGDATAAAADANPDQKFSIIDFAYDPTKPNVVGQIYAIDQAAFLAGYVAASATETGIVGTFGGINIPPVTQFMDGYVFGVNHYNEENGTDVQVLGWDVDAQDGLFTGNFDSTDDGRALGESLMDEGADIILPVAGPVGLGTAAAVQERGNAWIIGVDTDWTVSAPDFADIVLTSIMKRMDISVVNVARSVAEGNFEGGLDVSTLANGGVSITDGPYDVDIQPLIDGIIAGTIVTAPGQEAMEEEAMMEEGAMAEMTPISICEVTDVGGIDDASFNATAWVGAQNAAEATGGTAQFLESQQQTDYDRNIAAFVDEGCDLIVGVGFLLGDAIAAASEQFPDSNFTIIDFAYDPPLPNVVGQVYASNQAAFLAGLVAADTTETGIVGVYGGINIPPVTDFMDGFVLGVDYYNNENGTAVQVLGWNIEAQDGLFIGNFDSSDDGRTVAESLMDEGADIIFPLAGAAGIGSGAAILERGNAWMIGADTDWRVSAPEFADITLVSTLKRMDISLVDVAKLVATDTFEGGVYLGTLENGGVGITDGPFDIDLTAITEMINAGEIQTTP